MAASPASDWYALLNTLETRPLHSNCHLLQFPDAGEGKLTRSSHLTLGRETPTRRIGGAGASSFHLAARVPGLSLRQYRLALVCLRSSAFLANSSRRQTRPRIYEFVKVERIQRRSAPRLHACHPGSSAGAPHASAEIPPDTPQRQTLGCGLEGPPRLGARQDPNRFTKTDRQLRTQALIERNT